MVFICRLCGKCENESLGIAIFGEQGVKEALAYKIKLSLDISVFEYDPLPKYICECCLGKLITTFTFQENCRRIQILLRERFLSSKAWSLNATTSTTEVEQLPNESVNGTDEIPVQETTPRIIEDVSYSNISETAYSQNEITEIHIEEHHDNLTNEVLTPSEQSNLQTWPRFVSAGPAADNTQREKNSRPQLEQPQAQTELTICGEPFDFNTFLRNGVLEELVQAVGNKGSKKSNSRKTKKTPNNASARKKQKTLSGLEPPPPNDKATFPILASNFVSPVTNVAVVQQTVNLSSDVGSHEASEVQESCTNTSVRNSAQSVHIEEVVVRPDVYMGPVDHETPQIVAVVNVQNGTTSSQLEDIHSDSNNTLKIVDVFSVQEISSTSTPEFINSTLHSSSTRNWHSPSSTEVQSNSLPSSTCMPSRSESSSTAGNWHTPVPFKNPQKTSKKKEQVVDTGSALNNMSVSEEEDEVLVVEIVKANKDSIAQHWEKCPSGFICKFCRKQYKRLNKCENHIRIHLGVKPYECHVCKRRYHKRRSLNEHFYFHTGKKLYQCKKCDKSFRCRKNFKTHTEGHVEELSSSYMCEICSKKFQLQFDYWSHKTSKHVIADPQTAQVK